MLAVDGQLSELARQITGESLIHPILCIVYNFFTFYLFIILVLLYPSYPHISFYFFLFYFCLKRGFFFTEVTQLLPTFISPIVCPFLTFSFLIISLHLFSFPLFSSLSITPLLFSFPPFSSLLLSSFLFFFYYITPPFLSSLPAAANKALESSPPMQAEILKGHGNKCYKVRTAPPSQHTSCSFVLLSPLLSLSTTSCYFIHLHKESLSFMSILVYIKVYIL